MGFLYAVAGLVNLRLYWRFGHSFLERRPSLSLGLFRFAVAFTVGCHVIPSFCYMADNYLPTAFKTQNYSFFPIGLLRLVESSPPWVIWGFMWLCLCALITFTIGLYTQLSCILLTLSCYYFSALNNYHIGTLSFDILLVTLVLMCASPYPGDFLSLDSLRRGKPAPYKRLRPFFIQRLLQLQLAWTYWYTALYKITAHGNWLTQNPYCALMHYPPIGVVRDFPMRAFLAQHPPLCYGFGVLLVIFETLTPTLWLIPQTRIIGIGLGWAFHLMLWITLHVPTIFLFLFPPMMLLFVEPERWVHWIESRQAAQAAAGRAVLLYDGQCGFCLESVKRLRILDLFGWVDPLDVHQQPDLPKLHPSLTPQRCEREMVLIEPTGRLSGGFDAFRQMAPHLPMVWPILPLFWLPGARHIGRAIYRWIAANRLLWGRAQSCETNQCHLASSRVNPSAN